MPRHVSKMKTKTKPSEPHDHKDKKRANNLPVGLVPPETDPDAGQKKTYQYDPHLVWAGKAERCVGIRPRYRRRAGRHWHISG